MPTSRCVYFPFPLFGVRMRCSISRGCGCLIPSSPCLPFALIGLRHFFPTSFCPLSSVHDVPYDWRRILWKPTSPWKL
ncbi:hypothetical protein HU200_057720 [Digitaria exilis]|uniref:Uncharacterized protein n=1 Tax=Digitaria exilis TaxID=1010633 RepID=A0A835AAD0_9POAL|nr:hypothetical protein HU200_057720 [Digitaria exilis]